MQQFFEFPVTPVCTLDSFVVCDGNVAAYTFARRICDPNDSDKLLYLYGPSGSGKTHLLKAIVHELAADSPVSPFICCRDIRSSDQLLLTAQDAPMLVLDDLHLIPDGTDIQRTLWQLFNDFYSSGRVIAMAGQHPPRELSQLDDHLISRLLWGLVARVDVTDDASRRMIIRKVAEDRQVLVSDDLVDYVLATTGREAGQLIAAFEQVYRCSMSMKRKMSLALARQGLTVDGTHEPLP